MSFDSNIFNLFFNLKWIFLYSSYQSAPTIGHMYICKFWCINVGQLEKKTVVKEFLIIYYSYLYNVFSTFLFSFVRRVHFKIFHKPAVFDIQSWNCKCFMKVAILCFCIIVVNCLILKCELEWPSKICVGLPNCLVSCEYFE